LGFNNGMMLGFCKALTKPESGSGPRFQYQYEHRICGKTFGMVGKRDGSSMDGTTLYVGMRVQLTARTLAAEESKRELRGKESRDLGWNCGVIVGQWQKTCF